MNKIQKNYDGVDHRHILHLHRSGARRHLPSLGAEGMPLHHGGLRHGGVERLEQPHHLPRRGGHQRRGGRCRLLADAQPGARLGAADAGAGGRGCRADAVRPRGTRTAARARDGRVAHPRHLGVAGRSLRAQAHHPAGRRHKTAAGGVTGSFFTYSYLYFIYRDFCVNLQLDWKAVLYSKPL